ncbi:zinc-binding dehydrogenase [Variovorax sp. GT1P44]|uniref:zinc-binding dehydrogenase n=1 Tax=Variovorax sp. GT1P44 TaxID=3443742 RepID=UPI003F4775DD
MKAAVLQQRGRDGLFVREAPMPIRRDGEVLLRVHAAGLNRVDLYMRDNGSGITHDLPQTLGVEAAGVVVEADADSGLAAGQKAVVFSNAFCGTCRYCLAGDQPLCLRANIMGEHRDGGFAEYVAMPARCVLPLPEHVDLVEAGALLAAYLTAWRMLFGKRALRPGETVLVVGVGGGVAVACLQLAVQAGARVLVTSSSDEKIERALALGAAAGVNYRREKVAKRILALTHGEGVDMVIDSVGEASWDDSLRSLRRGGRLVTCGATTGSNPSADLQRLFIRQLEVYGSTGGSIEECRQLLALFGAGSIRPVIDRRYTLDELPAAFDRLANGEQFGKIVITMGAEA